MRVFVTATDTGVGKTETACALLSLLADAGLKPAPFKPYESGCADLARPADALALRRAAKSTDPLERICVHRFEAPLAPGVAAARLGVNPSFAATMAAYRTFAGRPLVAEGAGGLYAPIDSKRDVIDLIHALKLPVLLVARAGLGTLNHVALSLKALGPVAAVLLVKSSPAADPSEADNPEWIRRRHRIPVLGPVPWTPAPVSRRRSFREALRPLFASRGLRPPRG